MNVPAQRGADTGGQDATVLGFVAESLRRLEDQVTRGFDVVNMQLSKLPETYVPRREFDRYRDELSLDWQTAVQARDSAVRDLKADVKAVRDEVADNEAKRVSRGRYVLTTLIALAAVLVAMVALIFTHVA